MSATSRVLAYDQEESSEDDLIRVGAGTDPKAVASAITNAFYETPTVTLRAIGAGSVNQAIKAVAIARGYVAVRGVDLVCRPGLTYVHGYVDENQITAVVLRLSLV